jgi:hypothetical protein
MGQLQEWMINGTAVIAFILLVKLLASYLPDAGVFGSLKKVLANI